MKKRMNRYSVEDQMKRYNITEEEAEIKVVELKANINKWNLYSIKDQMERYNITKEEAEEKIKNIKNVNVFSVEWQMKRYNITKEEAEEKIKNIKVKREYALSNMSDFDFNSMSPSKKEHWVKKGYSDEESMIKVIENIKKTTYCCNKSSKDRLMNPGKYIGVYDTSIEYYLKRGYSTEESKVLLKDRQTTFSISKCIKKYGEVEGLKKWKDRQEKWNSSLLENGNLKIGYSKISQILFNEICESIKILDGIFYGSKNKEISLANGKNGFLYDFTDMNSKKIIEFNGDIFHGNPTIYNENDKPNPFKDLTCSELWEKDRIKNELAINNGFEVLIVWESEYRINKEITIKKCLDFLNS